MRPGVGRILAVILFVACAALLISSETPIFDKHNKAFYLDEKTVNFVRPGLVVDITSAEIAADGTIKARVKVTDPKGLGLDRLGVETPGAVSLSFIAAHIPEGQKKYVSYTTRTQTTPADSPRPGVSAVQAAGESNGTFRQIAVGEYEYTFRAKAANSNPNETHTIGVYASRALTEFDLGTQYDDDVFTWKPAGGEVTVVRDIIKTETCNKCHDFDIAGLHGGPRKTMELCILCHQDQTVDPDTGNTQDMTVLIHKIHMGEELPSVKAGTPYVIIGNRQSVHDYSHVVYPVFGQTVGTRNFPGIMDCTSCHEQGKGAKQETAWLEPSRQACGSCHDDVNFATGANHANLPQFSDNQCKNCHTVAGESEFDLSITGAHLIPRQSEELKGVVFDIIRVENGTAGQKPNVVFSVKNKEGVALDITKFNRLSLVLGGPNSDYTQYASEDVRTAAKCTGGECSYTFNKAIPADAKGSWTVFIEGRQAVKLLAGTTRELSFNEGGVNAHEYFSVDGTAVQPRRQVVSLENCNQCHGQVVFHGENRFTIESCVTCHNPKETDAARRPADKLPAQTVDFKYMIHRIHMGGHANPNTEYTVYGFGNVPHDFTHIGYPSNLARCTNCHVNGSQNIDGKEEFLQTVKTQRQYLPEVGGITAACGSCHTSKAAWSHALANTTQLGESCAACHGSNAQFSVDRVHAQ